ncbi:MAG TPA: PKD domain-containing protein [Candidatus Eisenbacteria bacterium]
MDAARVTVTDNGGATASASQTVTASPPANLPPVARLTVTPSSGTAPLAVRADASASSDPDGTIASYRFDFGDGTVVGPQSGATATHTYAAGNWTARVTVTDDRGATASASQTVTVSTPNQPPVASLTALPSSGFSPLPAVASAVGSSDPDGSIVSYRFDFGDGTVVGPQSLPTAAHVYGAGTWVVRLTVTDNGGATGTASATVTVSGLLGPLGSAEPVAGSSPDAVAEAGPALIDRVIPNPVRSEALLAFATTRAGALSVQVFDAGGRRVRTLMDEAQAAPAPYVVRIDGRDERGVPLRGGIYWYRIRSAEGPRVGRFVITR